MLSGLKIGNFKAFSDTQYIPIRPLTLIFGPNSSGKSSVIHSLLLAHEAMKNGNLDIHRTEIGGDSVDLGGFKQYVFNRDTDRQIEWAIDLNTKKFQGRLQEIFQSANKTTIGITIKLGFVEDIPDTEDFLDLDIDEFISTVEWANKMDKAAYESLVSAAEGWKKYRYRSLKLKDILVKRPQINTFRIEADDKSLLNMSIRKGGLLRLEYINNDIPIFAKILKSILEASTTTLQITPEDLQIFNEAISELVSQITTVNIPKFLPSGIKLQDQPVKEESEIIWPIRKDRRKEDLIAAFNLVMPRLINEIIQGLTGTAGEQLNRLRYLGPLRSYPPRHLAFAQYHDPNWDAGGGYAWDEVSRNVDLREKINEWLGDQKKLSTPYQLVVQNLLTIDQLEDIFAKRISDIEDKYTEELTDSDDFLSPEIDDLFGKIYEVPKDLKILEQDLAVVPLLALKDKRTDTIVSHRDVGIGVSQVLPVLVSAYGTKNSIIAIEQPEIHLHPALQAELGDVFIESSLGENKNTFLIETHSEHIILRLLRRVRETSEGNLEDGKYPIAPSDIAVVYAQPTPKGAILRELRVTKEGEFRDKWPEGFFTERAKELF